MHSILQHVILDEKVGPMTTMKELYQNVVFPLHKQFKKEALKGFLAWYE